MAPIYSDDEDDGATPPIAKKQRSTLDPTSFVTWNCNGLLSRAKGNKQETHQLITSTSSSPDVIVLQEVRLKATSPTRRGEPCREDLQKIESLFASGGPFHQHDLFWSLADTRYSGTLTLLHKRLGGIQDNMAAFSTQGATDLLLNKFGLTRKDVGLSQTLSASKRQQASIKSFFSTSNNATSTSQEHDEQGRFQFFSFQNLDLIHTYVPNHGTKPESFQRREDWDKSMLDFLQARKAILEKAGVSRKLLWAGDLNVARDYRDGTHWTVTKGGQVDEWWTNEKKCFSRPGDADNRSPQHCGMPSFTPAERTRFNNILKQGQLLDVWRELHPEGSTTHAHLSKWERPDYTWRGTLGKNGKKAKYEGTGQRLDYFLTNNIPMEHVQECEILGHGTAREGLFCGSDHCAVKLVLASGKEVNND